MPTNPVGTVQSIEHALRNLDKLAAEQQNRVARIEKELADYQSQADRPFEHEERLKQLLARQSELNSFLDLDKGDQQGADSAPDLKDDPQFGRTVPATSRGRDEVAKMAEAYMRASGTAIREMPIAERTPPQTGPVTGRAVAKDEAHVAVATAANSFFVVPSTFLGSRCTNRRTIVSALSSGPRVDRRRQGSRKMIICVRYLSGRPPHRRLARRGAESIATELGWHMRRHGGKSTVSA